MVHFPKIAPAAARLAMIVAMLLMAGCSSLGVDNPFARGYEEPPTVNRGNTASSVASPRRTVVIVGRFDSPSSTPVPWRDIGPGMSDALSRTLLNDQRFDVRINDPLADRIARIVRRDAGNPTSDLLEAGREYREVDFVITGRVTDFHHTAELPGAVQRRGLFAPKNEAVAAIELSIVDLRTGRVAVADHVLGTARAGGESTRELYADLAFGSYLFWSTPLGKASREAIDKTVGRLRVVMPFRVAELSVSSVEGWRHVTLNGGKIHGIERGQRYFVCIRDEPTGRLIPIRDEVLGTPLQAQITDVSRNTARAWLMGEAPAKANLSRAVLTREQPGPSDAADDEALAGVPEG